MPTNHAVENVFGTIGASEPTYQRMDGLMSARYRDYMLDCAAHTPTMEELSIKVDGRTVTFPGVRWLAGSRCCNDIDTLLTTV